VNPARLLKGTVSSFHHGEKGSKQQTSNRQKCFLADVHQAPSTSEYVSLTYIPVFSNNPEQVSAQPTGFGVPCEVPVSPGQYRKDNKLTEIFGFHSKHWTQNSSVL